MARIHSSFYRGILTNYTEDMVAVFFDEPSPEFHQLYAKENINQVVENVPVNISRLYPGARVLVEFEPNIAVLGTVSGEYGSKNNNSNKSYSNSNSNSNDNNIDTLLLQVNSTIRADESGREISVANKTIWFLPVQLEDKGNFKMARFFQKRGTK